MVDSHAIFAAAILIVDDRLPNIELLEQVLQSAGYHNLQRTTDPFEVSTLHAAQRFDLILLDLQMPGMDGFAVMAALHAIDAPGYSPILAITAQPQHRLRALRSGAKDFITKPFDQRELLTRIYNMVEMRLQYKALQQSVQAMESEALHDELTGLPNRRLLLDRLQQAGLRSSRSGQQEALIFMDLDGFKQLNDTHGHDMGDQLLQQVAARLHDSLREGDCVARLGGDEFVVLLAALSAKLPEASAQALAVAQKMQQALQQPYLLGSTAITSTASMGIALFSGEALLQEELLKMADLAMYQAKAAGGNQCCVFDPAAPAVPATREPNLQP
ncbi:MAG: diguanylate cyclase [Rhodoferax sp.]|nr:diguanylate cyclase [Rhodoferax sp.]